MPKQFHIEAKKIIPIRYVQKPGIPIEDYKDFFHAENNLSHDEVVIMCRYGNFPPGLILKKQGKIVQVVGDYGSHQTLKVVRR